MSFFSKLYCWAEEDFGPEKEFVVIMDEEMSKRGATKGKVRAFGTKHERMTSPGREAMRDYLTSEKPNRVDPNKIRDQLVSQGRKSKVGSPPKRQNPSTFEVLRYTDESGK